MGARGSALEERRVGRVGARDEEGDALLAVCREVEKGQRGEGSTERRQGGRTCDEVAEEDEDKLERVVARQLVE